MAKALMIVESRPASAEDEVVIGRRPGRMFVEPVLERAIALEGARSGGHERGAVRQERDRETDPRGVDGGHGRGRWLRTR